MNVPLALLSAGLAAMVATFATMAVEKLGVATGGVIASGPTLLVPYSIGLALTTPADSIIRIEYTVAIMMVSNTFYLISWRELPRISFIKNIENIYKQLAIVLPLVLTLWLSGCTLLLQLITTALDNYISIRILGWLALLFCALLGLVTLFSRHQPSPVGSKKVSRLMYLARGLLAATTIGIAVGLSTISSSLSGVASAFPAVVTTTMVVLWISQHGPAVPGGAVASMILGNLSNLVYWMCFGEIFVSLTNGGVDLGIALTAALLVAFSIAVSCFSIPVYFLTRAWRKKGENLINNKQGLGETEISLEYIQMG